LGPALTSSEVKEDELLGSTTGANIFRLCVV